MYKADYCLKTFQTFQFPKVPTWSHNPGPPKGKIFISDDIMYIVYTIHISDNMNYNCTENEYKSLQYKSYIFWVYVFYLIQFAV